jgi:hypothetical protein
MFTGFQKKITILSMVSNAYVGDTDCPFYRVTVRVCVCGSFIAEKDCVCWHISGPLLYVGVLLKGYAAAENIIK